MIFYNYTIQNVDEHLNILKTFMGANTIMRRLPGIVARIYGEAAVVRSGWGKPIRYLLSPRYRVEEGAYITPSASNSFSNAEELKAHLTGSKLVVYRFRGHSRRRDGRSG